jgi:hypothetical protein
VAPAMANNVGVRALGRGVCGDGGWSQTRGRGGDEAVRRRGGASEVVAGRAAVSRPRSRSRSGGRERAEWGKWGRVGRGLGFGGGSRGGKHGAAWAGQVGPVASWATAQQGEVFCSIFFIFCFLFSFSSFLILFYKNT